MGGLPGLEKFSHLEDKIYRTIEVAKQLREERDRLARRDAAREDGRDRPVIEFGQRRTHPAAA